MLFRSPVEAQACGTPVIAYGRGGAQETVLPGTTGVFFAEQSTEHLKAAVDEFERLEPRLNPEDIRAQAERFSIDAFRASFSHLIHTAYADFIDGYALEGDPHRISDLVEPSIPNVSLHS